MTKIIKRSENRYDVEFENGKTFHLDIDGDSMRINKGGLLMTDKLVIYPEAANVITII